MSADALNKFLIVASLCGLGVVLSAIEGWIGLHGHAIPTDLDHLDTLVVGGLLGLLGRTSAEKPPQSFADVSAAGSQDGVEVPGKQPGGA